MMFSSATEIIKWDTGVFATLVFIHCASWLGLYSQGKLNKQENDATIRQTSAEIMNSSSTSGITAVSILLPASLLILELFGTDVNTVNIFRASAWMLLSLFLGLFLIFLIPMKSQSRDVARDLFVGLLFGPQLFALFFGVAWLVIVLYQTTTQGVGDNVMRDWDEQMWRNAFASVVENTTQSDEDMEDVIEAGILLGRRRAELLERDFDPAVDVPHALSILCFWPFKPQIPDTAEAFLKTYRSDLIRGTAVYEAAQERLRNAVLEEGLVMDTDTLFERMKSGDVFVAMSPGAWLTPGVGSVPVVGSYPSG